MKLKDSLESQGQYLFKNRGFIPLLFVLFSIPVSYFNSYDYLTQYEAIEYIVLISSLLFVFCGHCIRIHVVLSRNESTSGRNRDGQVANSLNTDGWYSLVRNPLYFANFLIWFGLSIYLFSFLLSILLFLAFWIYYERIIYAEESYLQKKFEKPYDDWCMNTPLIIPKFTGYKPVGLKFSIKKTVLNEYPSFLSTSTCFLFVYLLREYCQYKNLDLDFTVVISAGLILIFGLCARFYKYSKRAKNP